MIFLLAQRNIICTIILKMSSQVSVLDPQKLRKLEESVKPENTKSHFSISTVICEIFCVNNNIITLKIAVAVGLLQTILQVIILLFSENFYCIKHN